MWKVYFICTRKLYIAVERTGVNINFTDFWCKSSHCNSWTMYSNSKWMWFYNQRMYTSFLKHLVWQWACESNTIQHGTKCLQAWVYQLNQFYGKIAVLEKHYVVKPRLSSISYTSTMYIHRYRSIPFLFHCSIPHSSPGIRDTHLDISLTEDYQRVQWAQNKKLNASMMFQSYKGLAIMMALTWHTLDNGYVMFGSLM